MEHPFKEKLKKQFKFYIRPSVTSKLQGRTDAGVNAFGQVAHVDVPKNNEFSTKNNFYLVYALNSLLRKTNIRIISIQNTSNDFNARFSATKEVMFTNFFAELLRHQS